MSVGVRPLPYHPERYHRKPALVKHGPLTDMYQNSYLLSFANRD